MQKEFSTNKSFAIIYEIDFTHNKKKNLLNFPDIPKNIFFFLKSILPPISSNPTYTNTLLANQRAKNFLSLYTSLFNPFLIKTIFFSIIERIFYLEKSFNIFFAIIIIQN